MSRAEFDDQPRHLHAALEKAGSIELLDAIDDAAGLLESDPGSAAARHKSCTAGVWGIAVRTRTDDWLAIWPLPCCRTKPRLYRTGPYLSVR